MLKKKMPRGMLPSAPKEKALKIRNYTAAGEDFDR